MKASAEKFKNLHFHNCKNLTLYLKLVILIGSNGAAWISTGIIQMLSMFQNIHSSELMMWAEITITPLAIMNPLLSVTHVG